MNLPRNENQETPPTSIDRPKEAWADKWVLDDSLPSKGGNQSLVRAVREIDANRQGALKTTKHSSNSERRARMVREAQILKQLAGISGVPQLLDQNVSVPKDEAFFIVLEWIDGAPLSEHFRGTVPIDESAEIALKLCTIVQQCHERGVIHRDIKPDNILINRSSDDVWLIDFGIGWTESGDDSFATEISQELGNRFLRLPELYSSDPGSRHDHRCDITFVCGVFFWLLTHSRPFQLTNEKLEAPHIAQANRFPQDVRADRRWDLVKSIFDVGFAPGVNSRFQAASELSDRLKELLEPASPADSNDRLSEQDRLLLEFQNRAEVIHRRQIDEGILGASNLLLSKLTTMANRRNLFSTSTGSQKMNVDMAYFRFLVKLRDADNQFSDVCHWVRITGSGKSYVEASFDYTSFPTSSPVPDPYYRGSVSDISRLRSAVDTKANEIFAELVRRLLEKHST